MSEDVLEGRTLAQWCSDLTSAERDVQFSAAQMLIAASLKTPDMLVPVVEVIAKAAEEVPPDLQELLLMILANLGKYAEAAIPSLVRIQDRGDVDAAVHAARALALAGRLDLAVPTIERVLDDPERHLDLTEILYDVLTALGPQAHLAIPILKRNLRAPALDACPLAAKVLSAVLGPGVFPVLEEALEEAPAIARECLLEVLGEFGKDAAHSLPAVAKRLRCDLAAEVRREAALALTLIGRYAATAQEAFRAALGDDDIVVRCTAAAAILGSDTHDPRLLEVVRSGVTTRDEIVLVGILVNLSRFAGPELGDVVLELIIALRQYRSPHNIPGLAARALARIGDKAVNPLIEMLEGDQYVRYFAVKAIEMIGLPARAALPLLIKIWHDRDMYYKRSVPEGQPEAMRLILAVPIVAMLAICKIASRGDDDLMIPLFEALGCENNWVRQAAATALATIGKSSDQIVHALRALLFDRYEEVRHAAAYALACLDPDA